ncbi:MAG: cob(I)yrinic acid a,c-diamide adenosyltransferase [Planctomycetes bacterium]|nr:cob(I)yrinic acid a,c-diamide adenosyltransferase [Planctomycetota bacterium]
MPIYTGTGDDGDTGLFGNQRVAKDDARIEAYGAVDELNSCLGMLRAEGGFAAHDARLESIQNTLFDLGADLATVGGRASLPRLIPATRELERWIDESEGRLPQLTSFVLPGGCRTAATLHVLRTVARRAERRYWTLRRDAAPDGSAVPGEIGVYLNRLSDLLFSWARLANLEAGVDDVPWHR